MATAVAYVTPAVEIPPTFLRDRRVRLIGPFGELTGSEGKVESAVRLRDGLVAVSVTLDGFPSDPVEVFARDVEMIG